MTDGQSQTPKNSSNFNDTRKWFKKTFSRSRGRSTSPQLSASGQENRRGEIAPVLSSGAQSIIPVIGAPAATSQQGVSYPSSSAQHVDHTPTHLLRSPSRGPSVSAVVQSQHKTPTQDGAASISPSLKPHELSSSYLSVAKDYARVL